jgi:hypothetical protein
MTDIEKRLRQIFSSMAGNESLADGLLDEDAVADMLKWGEAIAEHFVRKTNGMEDDMAEEFLAPYLRALRLLLRSIGKWISEKNEAARQELWTRIEQNAKILYGEQLALPSLAEVTAQIPVDANAQRMVAFLRNLMDSQGLKG